MKINDALNILGLTGTVNQKEIKTAYKKLSLKYHPDRNKAGLEMMKVINEAFSTLKDFGETVTATGDSCNYSEVLNKKLNEFYDLNLEGVFVEVCGNWIWITGNTKQYSKLLGKNGLKFFYAKNKTAWYFRPEDYKSYNRKSHTLDEIRTKYGSDKPTKQKKQALKAA